ncbi:MAG TPA: amino acid adenylation domain-containing protein [Gemmatimonadales bacterium]|nr:amino acid adenylation domain-containing protein [Gemmatimonadales bacterium]
MAEPTGEERTRLDRWTACAQPFPDDRCVHQLIEEQVARTPGRRAVVCGDTVLTYAELDVRANRLAHRLRAAGIGPETAVGIHVRRSPELVVALLAVWKAGGAYVPLDPAYPPARLTYMIADSAIPLVLTEQALAASLSLPPGARALAVDGDAAPAGDEGTAPPALHHDPSQLAQVIYTSGSTGVPKGAEITHRSAVNLLSAFQRTPGFSADDVYLAISTFSFDIAEMEICLPLIVGGTVAIASRETALDAERLGAELRRSGATWVFATPTIWQMLIDGGWTGQAELTALCGGEPLPQDLAEQILSRAKALWNIYGPTETTICSATTAIQPGRPVRIGEPVANTIIRILDENLRLCPIGTIGELCIGGAGLARGYRGRPDLTAERFVPDPYAPGERLYRTGDRARWDAQGSLEYHGRVDFQVKIRGQRIEPGEIETRMTQIDGVGSAVVVVRKDPAGQPTLCGYVVPAPGTPLPSATEIKARLRAVLPHVMVPQAIVALAAFPLSPNGKIDRLALPAPTFEADPGRPFEAPRTEQERQVAELFAEILNVERVGRNDHFLDLGGHSIMAMRVINRLEASGEKRLSLARFLERPTVAVIASMLAEAPDGESHEPPPLTRLARVHAPRNPRRGASS